jgi:hypothetical protein
MHAISEKQMKRQSDKVWMFTADISKGTETNYLGELTYYKLNQ